MAGDPVAGARLTTQLGDEIRRAIADIRRLVYGLHPADLERDGIVARTVHAQVPPKVEYSLTPLGVELDRVLEPLGRWGEQHMDHILAVRRAG